MRYGLAMAAMQLLAACSGNETAVPVPETEAGAEAEAPSKLLVLAFGDSLYAGYGLAPNDGFVPELQAGLRAKGLDVTVHNAGVSGDTSAAGLGRMTFVLDSLDRKPDLVLLGLGGNDMLRGLKPEETAKNMAEMLDILKSRELPVVLTGMLAPPNMGPEYGEAFNRIYPDLAKQYGASLYPFFMQGVVGREDLRLEDGIHPNEKGIDVIVENIAPLVEAQLRELP
jgi:acyl-CoA thioesterase-1